MEPNIREVILRGGFGCSCGCGCGRVCPSRENCYEGGEVGVGGGGSIVGGEANVTILEDLSIVELRRCSEYIPRYPGLLGFKTLVPR